LPTRKILSALLAVVLFVSPSFAQTYQSPTYGSVILRNPITASNQATTKAYVDAQIAIATAAGVTSFGGATGAITVGTNLAMAGNTVNASGGSGGGGGGGSGILSFMGRTTAAAVLQVSDITTALGAPAIFSDNTLAWAAAARNGVIYAHYWPGITYGRGLTTSQRTANVTAWNDLISQSFFQGKKIIASGELLEIYGTALTVPAGAGFRADFGGMTVWQYSNNLPVMQIGGYDFSYVYNVSNINLNYGVDVTGQTNTTYLRIGSQAWSVFENIGAGQQFDNTKAYDGVQFTNGGGGILFSSSMRNFIISGAQHTLMFVNATGTQNYWENFYLNNGGGTSNPVTGACVTFDGYGSEQMGGVFNILNVEWCASNKAMYTRNFKGMHLQGLHFEGILMTGLNPTIFSSEASEIYVQTLELKTTRTNGTGALAATGTPRVFSGYQAEIWDIENFKVEQDTPGEITVPIQVIGNPGTGGPLLQVRNATFQDIGGGNLANWSWDANINGTSLPVGRTMLFRTNFRGSSVWGAQIATNVNTANFGWNHDAEYLFPNTLGSNRDLILSRNQTSAGVTIATTSGTAGTPVINVPSSAGAGRGVPVIGTGVAAGSKVLSFTPTTITLDTNLAGTVATGGITLKMIRQVGDTVSVIRDCGTGDGFTLNVKDDEGNILQGFPSACASRVFMLAPSGYWAAINGID
jgi:hypothetical protein